MRNAPVLRLMLILTGLTVVGALALAQPVCTPLDQRAAAYFWAHHYWQCAFDALSAVCSGGLLARNVDQTYSPPGRWVLAGLALTGGMAHLLTIWSILARGGPNLFLYRTPRARVALLAWAAAGLLVIGGGALWTLIGSEAPLDGDAAWALTIATAGFGPASSAPQPPIIFAWLLGLGWPVWLACYPGVARNFLRMRAVLVAALAYTLLLATTAGVIAWAEAPRGGVVRDRPEVSYFERYQDAARLVTIASGTGRQTRPLAEREASELTRVGMAGLALLGGLAPGPGGGLSLLLLVFAAQGLLTSGHGEDRITARWTRAALGACGGLIGLTLIGAIGLLIIEQIAATRYTPAPTFSAALLDAASAVGGAGLSAGLTETVTSRNLAQGLRLPVNLYEFGMAWLMLLMIAGRLWPVMALSRVIEAEGTAAASSRR